MIKKLLAVLVVLIVVAAIGGVYYVKSNLDSIVLAAIEKYGSAATQTSVKLDKVKIVIATGEAALTGLSVGSPSGFTAEKSLYLGDIDVKINTASLTGDGPILIDEITIEKPQVTYEINGNGAANLQTIAHNAQGYAAENGSGGKSKAAEAQTKKEQGRKVIITSLTVRDGQIAILQPLLKGKQLSAALPVIHLTNIGKNSGGATAAEVAEQLLAAITNSATQIAKADLAKELGSRLKDATGGLINGGTNGISGQFKGLLGK